MVPHTEMVAHTETQYSMTLVPETQTSSHTVAR